MNQDLSLDSSASRVMLIDIVRGFALLGIILVRVQYSYFGKYMEPEYVLSWMDNAVVTGVNIFLKNKFYTIFSFLFGIGFAIQLSSAARKNQPFLERFLWRLLLLLVIGVLHSLIYPSDILRRYAILGLLLIPIRNLRNASVLMISAMLFLLASVNLHLSKELAGYLSALKGHGVLFWDEITSYAVSGRLGIIACLFVLGLYAGRKRIFHDNLYNRRLFRIILLVSAPTAFLTMLVLRVVADVYPLSHYVETLTILIQILSFSSLYLAGVAYLYFHTRFAGVLNLLAPVGRMALTNYILQSVFLIFLGLVNVQKLAPGFAGVFGIAILFFLLQILFSRYWLEHFRFGPIEWVWRYVTNWMSARMTYEKTGQVL